MRNVREEELKDWAEHRADDAGRLSRDVLEMRSDFIEALEDCAAYFDNKADADCDDTGFVPNKEMVLLHAVRAAIAKAEGRS